VWWYADDLHLKQSSGTGQVTVCWPSHCVYSNSTKNTRYSERSKAYGNAGKIETVSSATPVCKIECTKSNYAARGTPESVYMRFRELKKFRAYARRTAFVSMSEDAETFTQQGELNRREPRPPQSAFCRTVVSDGSAAADSSLVVIPSLHDSGSEASHFNVHHGTSTATLFRCRGF